MRDYATVAPQFWLGKTGRELRKKGAEAQVVSFYLMTSPHANMLGLYYLPILYIAHETGLGLEGASKGLKSTIEAGFCSYDEDTEMVWVHEMAAYQVGKALKPGDNRCAGVRSEYASLTENPFLSLFYERYKDDFHLNVKRESCPTPEGASKGLRSQDQEQEQEQEQDKDLSGHGSATPQMVDPPMKLHLKSRKAVTRRNLNWPGGNTQSAQEAIARSMRSKPGLPELNQAQQRRSLPMVFDDMRITSLLPENSTLST
ncbi:hypothetical protein [Klebsiella pneumoniae]|uniref:hypothetical protein n=1 Tax=Klebsiella pneumoniae TaxID=573 RepID=UPI000DC1CF8B|nr:hypothetical protein CHC10_04243 [Klebsiella pneumoniae]BBE54344.1 Primosomal protein I [Klebsiella pneumoniae]